MGQFAPLESWAKDLVDRHRLANTEITIYRRDQMAFRLRYGFMDLQRQRPLIDDAIFRIYSMTKPVICAAVLMLMEDGRLALTDPVAKYIPALANLYVFNSTGTAHAARVAAHRDITIHDLLSHTAGLTYGGQEYPPVSTSYRVKGIDFSKPHGTLAELADRVGSCDLYFQPGSRWIYSIANDILGRVIEVASGQNLDRFLAQRLFLPLQMPDTSFHVAEADRSRFVSNFCYGPSGALEDCSDQSDDRFLNNGTLLSGGGGLVSTSKDYLRFLQLLLGRGTIDDLNLLDPASVDLMTSNQLPGDLPSMGCPIHSKMDMAGIGYGYGVSVLIDAEKAAVHGSTGDYGWGGVANTYFWVDPRQEMIVLFMSQLLPAADMPIRTDLRHLVYQSLADAG